MNTLSAAWTIARKDLKTFLRDRVALSFGFLLPIVLVTLFGWIMAFAFGGSGGMPRVTLWVVDEDQTDRSQKVIDQLRQSEMVHVLPETDQTRIGRENLRAKVADGDAHHGVVIPKGYAEQLSSGLTPELQMVRDPGREMEDGIIQIALMQAMMTDSEGSLWTNSVTKLFREEGMDATQVELLKFAFMNVDSVIRDFISRQERLGSPDKIPSDTSISPNEKALTQGDSTSRKKSRAVNPIKLLSRIVPVKNEDIVPPSRPKQATYQQAQSISGVAVMMLMFGLTGAGALLLAEREQGTLKRLFGLAIPRESVLLSKFIFVSVIGVVQMGVVFIYAELLFRVGLFRDPVTLLILVVTWVATAGSFGMTIATFAKSAKQGDGLATILILAMAALGGCWFPIQLMTMPLPLEILCKSTMTYWAMEGFQGMLWNNLNWTDPKMLKAIGIQWLWATALATLSIYLFRRNYCRG